MLFDYDRSSADSILHYARQLEGRTFLEIKREFNPDPETDDEEALTEDTNAKGQLGNFLEKNYLWV